VWKCSCSQDAVHSRLTCAVDVEVGEVGGPMTCGSLSGGENEPVPRHNWGSERETSSLIARNLSL
jgi:hypothetical protein